MTHSNIHLTPGDGAWPRQTSGESPTAKIVGHWDVIQEVPEMVKNDNTMF